MFGTTIKNEKINIDKIDTLISKNVSIEGQVSSTGTVRFDCKVVGDINAEGVIIGETGKIKGNIKCNEIIVSGIVEGKVTCKNTLHIKETGSQIGDVEVSSIIIDEGAKFMGNCQMKSTEPHKTIISSNNQKEKLEK